MNYLIEVIADSNDADYISENYLGTDKDLDNIKTILSYLKLFFDKFYEIYNGDKYGLRHSDLMKELDKCFYVISGGKLAIYQVKKEEFLDFVKDNLEKAEYLHAWISEHWPEDYYEPCHTLESIKAYKLQTINPVMIYGRKH